MLVGRAGAARPPLSVHHSIIELCVFCLCVVCERECESVCVCNK